MRMNPEKCVFGVEGKKFWGFMLMHRGIRANPNKCQAIIEMQSLKCTKEVQRLIGRLMTLSRFMPNMVDRTRSIINLLKKTTKFQWNYSANLPLHKLNKNPPIIHKSLPDKPLLPVLEDTINSVLVQEVDSRMGTPFFVPLHLIMPLLLWSGPPY